MAQVTTGLTNGGRTTHYQISYDDSLSTADGRDRANALIAVCEGDFALVSGWFGGITLRESLPISVQIVTGPYASAGFGPPIWLKPGDGGSVALVRYLLVAEITEMFMEAQDKGWWGRGNEGSNGEPLSRFLATEFLRLKGLGSAPGGFELSNSWLSSARADFVNNVDLYDHGVDARTGCGMLFICYLRSQLGFSLEQIIAAAAPTLAGVYQNLTGDPQDPFPLFKEILDKAFPGTATIVAEDRDNPFPLPYPSWISIWTVDALANRLSTREHGPCQGWVPLACSGDRLLWRTGDNRISLWLLDAQSNQVSYQEYGPFPGWAPVNYADGKLLWHNPDGRISLWNLDASGKQTSYREHGPLRDWRPINYAGYVGRAGMVGKILWHNPDGRISLWSIDASGAQIDYQEHGPFPGWTPIWHENARVLFRGDDGRISLWVIDSYGKQVSYKEHGPFPGWTVVGYTKGHILWRQADGRISLWNVNASGEQTSYQEYGPFPGWNPVNCSGSRVLWRS